MVYCWKCGSELRDEALFCPKCGASIHGTMGVQPRTGLELLRDDGSVQNHWARRVVAIVVDAIIVSVILSIIAVVTAVSFLISFPSGAVSTFPAWWAGWWGFWWAAGLVGVILFLYFVVAEALYGRTIGKEIMGLRVERIDGGSMDLRSSFIRNISKLHWLLLLIDVAVGLGVHGEMSQKWSDRFAGTKVEEKTHLTIIP